MHNDSYSILGVSFYLLGLLQVISHHTPNRIPHPRAWIPFIQMLAGPVLVYAVRAFLFLPIFCLTCCTWLHSDRAPGLATSLMETVAQAQTNPEYCI